MTNSSMPQRPHEHVLETISRRKFEINLETWVARHLGGDDYGIDLQVEIFRDNLATGDLFAVQLKAQRDAGPRPTATVKRSSINYWRSQPMPTLVVLWEEKSDTLWMRWAHQVPQGKDPESETRTFPLEVQWDEDSLEQIDSEVRAYRAVRELASHTPVELLVQGDRFLGADAGTLQNEISRFARGMPDVRVRFSSATIPYIRIDIDEEIIGVTASGSVTHELRYAGAAGAVEAREAAADVFVRVAYILGDFGQLEALALEMLRRTANSSGAILSNGRLADTVAVLARAGSFSAVKRLFERSVAGAGPYREQALVGLLAGSGSLPANDARAISKLLKENARTGAEGGQDFYNAANVVRRADPALALSLYDRAAGTDPSYRERSYWWRERGIILETLDRTTEAEENYRAAASLGDSQAPLFIAEVLARRGKFADALQLLDSQTLDDELSLARFRLLKSALEHVVHDLDVSEQDLPDIVEHVGGGTSNAETYEQANRALQVHAFDGLTHWAKVPHLNDVAGEKLPTLIAAAVGASFVPQIWDELIREAFTREEWGLVEDALWCARESCEDDFIEMLHTDQFLDRDARRVLTFLYESQPDRPQDSFELRMINDGDVPETHRVSGGRPTRRDQR